jgi:transposase
MALEEYPTCQRNNVIKNGSAAGKPKRQCKQYGYQFTCMILCGKPFTTKVNAVLLYLGSVSMNCIAFLRHVWAQAVINRIRAFAKAHEEKPESKGRTIVLALDEMWHYLKNKCWIMR